MSEFFLSSEAAREVGVSVQMIRLLERQGKLPAAIKTNGGVRLFLARKVRQFAAERQRKAAKAK
jgi:DNA-binding transcriptional MerR regulator